MRVTVERPMLVHQRWLLLWPLWLACAVGTLAATERAVGAERGGPLFRVHTRVPGLDYVNVSGSREQLPILEQNGQGVCLLDYDNDGWIDLFVTNGGRLDGGRLRNDAEKEAGCRLYRNLGRWRFHDVSDRAGVGNDSGRVGAWGNGCAAADYDDDGDMDVYVTRWGPNVLYRNNGDGTFVDVTETARVGERAWSSSAVFADFDGDGRLDLYVSNYVVFDPDRVPAREADGKPCLYAGVETGCGPWRYDGVRDTLYIQRSGGRFEDVSESWGLGCTVGYRGMGIAAGDYDGDGDVDIYVGCDVMPNLYLENIDRRRFKSVGLLRGGVYNVDGKHESGMGVAAADLFDRGCLDIVATNFAHEKNTHYRNTGGSFEDDSAAVGIDKHRADLGWGVVMADFDQDGRRDVFVANGHIYPQVQSLNDPAERYAQPPRLYLGRPGEKLAEVPSAEAFAIASHERAPDSPSAVVAGEPVAFSLRAVACGDLDNDGDLDVVAVQHNGPLVVFENRSNQPAAVVTLLTARGGRSPHGAHIRVGSWHHFHWPTQGYQCSHDPRVFIRRGGAKSAAVRWADGDVEEFAVPELGQSAVWRKTRGTRPLGGTQSAVPHR